MDSNVYKQSNNSCFPEWSTIDKLISHSRLFGWFFHLLFFSFCQNYTFSSLFSRLILMYFQWAWCWRFFLPLFFLLKRRKKRRKYLFTLHYFFLLLYDCSCLGMHLFGGNFCYQLDGTICTCKELADDELASTCLCDRKNFDNFLWALITVFQVRLKINLINCL